MRKYADVSQLQSTADKLRWYRYHKGLLQRDVADWADIDRSTYISYEESGRDHYPIDKMERIAELLDVAAEDLMDDYNRFLYQGQGKFLKENRERSSLTQRIYADKLGVSLGTLKNWESNRVQMQKCTWVRLFQKA